MPEIELTSGLPASAVSLAPAAPEGVPFDFGTPPPAEPCSWNECSRGHKFPPFIQLAQCPGCKGPIIAVKMVNCPICNEPVARVAMRLEHLPQSGQITPMCQGAATLNEVIQLKVERNHARLEEAAYKDREMISKV